MVYWYNRWHNIKILLSAVCGFKLVVGVNSCLSLCLSPVIDQWVSHSETCLSSTVSCNKLKSL